MSAAIATPLPVKGKTEPKAIPHLDPSKIVPLEYRNQTWTGIAPAGITPKDLHRNPVPFELVPQQLARFDQLNLVDTGGQWWARYLCVDRLTGYAEFILLESVSLPSRKSDLSDRVPDGYEIVQGGPEDAEPWIARRIADGVVLNKNMTHKSREQALRFLLDHGSVRGDANPGIFGR